MAHLLTEPYLDKAHLFWWQSNERKGGGSAEDCVVYYGDDLHRNTRTLALKRVIIPHHIYNVSSNKNNLSTTGTWNGVAHTITLAAGNYTQAEILSAINTELGVDGTISYNANTNKITTTGAGAGAILDSAGSSLWLQLGFATDQLDQGAAASIAATNCPNLLATMGIHICLEGAPQPLLSFQRGGVRESIAYIPLNVPFGAVLSVQLEEPLHWLLYNRVLQRLKLTLRDDAGNIIDNNNSDWSALFSLVIVQ